MTIFPITENYHRGAVPRLGVRRDDKDRLLDAMRGQKPIAMAAGYLTDYATGETTNITDAMYEKNGVRWTEEMTYNLEHNDMEISDEFADALLGRGKTIGVKDHLPRSVGQRTFSPRRSTPPCQCAGTWRAARRVAPRGLPVPSGSRRPRQPTAHRASGWLTRCGPWSGSRS